MPSDWQPKTPRVADAGAPKPAPDSAAELLAFGLGSNVGPSEATLRWAIDRLRQLFGPLDVAPLYRTAPVSPIPQGDYLNSVTLAARPASGDWQPHQVLAEIKRLERLAGRLEGARFGPRPLDIDLLFFGDRVEAASSKPPPSAAGVGHSRELVLPHPRMRNRRFVLAPLNDLAPDLRLPPDGARVRELLASLGPDQQVEKISWSLP